MPEPLTHALGRVTSTLTAQDIPTLTATEAANVWAGTTDLPLVEALNRKAGNSLPDGYLDLLGVVNQLAGTTGLGLNDAAGRLS